MKSRNRREPRRIHLGPFRRPQRAIPGHLTQIELTVSAGDPPTWPSISVCMIVKDEAANLRACLESLGDLASEVIVVDTGSTDGTAEVARSMGARVHSFVWVDDFAAARNESLRHATGEWVFWLDADDRLTPKAVGQLKQVANSGFADAFMCMVTSREPDGRLNSVEHVRLFRNGLGISFAGAIHENVTNDLARLGLRVASTDIVVEHTGYSSVATIREKSRRNLQMIERQIELHPEQVELLFYRGHSMANLGRLDESLASMHQYLLRTAPQRWFGYRRFLAYSSSLAILDIREERAKFEALLTQALAEFPGHPHFQFLLARLRLLKGRPREALELLSAVHSAIQRPIRGLRPPDAWVELAMGEAHWAVGQRESALEWAERAREHAPEWEMAANFLVRLYLSANRIEEAESLLSNLLISPKSPEPWLILSELRDRQGRREEAVSAVREAQKLGLPEQQAQKRLARIIETARNLESPAPSDPITEANRQRSRGLESLRATDFVEAAKRFAAAVQSEPRNPTNYRCLAAALKALGREQDALAAWALADHWESTALAVTA